MAAEAAAVARYGLSNILARATRMQQLSWLQARPHLCLLQYSDRCVVAIKVGNVLYLVTSMTAATIDYAGSLEPGEYQVVPYCDPPSPLNCIPCPAGHCAPAWISPDDDPFKCDICGDDTLIGRRLYGCRRCDWDVCDSCVLAGRYPPIRPTIGDTVRIRAAGTTHEIMVDDRDETPYTLMGAFGFYEEREVELVAQRSR